MHVFVFGRHLDLTSGANFAPRMYFGHKGAVNVQEMKASSPNCRLCRKPWLRNTTSLKWQPSVVA